MTTKSLKTFRIKSFYFILLVLFSIHAYPQNAPGALTGQQRKILLKGGYSLITGDTIIYSSSDTIIYIPFSKEYYFKKGKAEDEIFQKLSERSKTSRIASTIANNVIRKSQRRLPEDTLNTSLSINYFKPYHHLIIRRVECKRLMPFGTSVTDTLVQTGKWYQKAGNATHIRTAQWVLKNNLLFKPGDEIEPAVLADNERILRELPYISDARILIKNVSPDGDSADVIIITKDVWSIGAGAELSDVDAGNIRIYDNNVLGSGKTFDNRIFWNMNKPSKLGYDGILRLTNIDGSFIDGTIEFIDYYGTQSYKAALNRNFFTHGIKYAGGVMAEHMTTFHRVNVCDTVLTPVSYRYAGCWAGRSFALPSNGNQLLRSNLVLSGSVIYYDYSERPSYVSPVAYYPYHDRILLLGSLAHTSQGFYKSNLIYNFGRTEDIPFGHMISVTGGMENSEFRQRPYLKIHLSGGMFLHRYGYLYTLAEAGSFLYHHRTEQAVTRIQLSYFSNLVEVGIHSLRSFVSMTYVEGHNMFTGEYLTINKSDGIRGFRDDSIRGISKIVTSVESNLFTPYYLLGFRFACFVFADIALIGNSFSSLMTNGIYSGIGCGIRLKNERLVLPAIQFRFTYYPNVTPATSYRMLDMLGENRLNPRDFYVRQPELVKFQ